MGETGLVVQGRGAAVSMPLQWRGRPVVILVEVPVIGVVVVL